MEGGKDGPQLESTPSWVVGAVVFVIVGISLAIEKLLHHLSKWLLKKEKIPLYLALEKIKEELMLLGFISLLVSVLKDWFGKWCISEELFKTWLHCDSKEKGRRRLLAENGETICSTVH